MQACGGQQGLQEQEECVAEDGLDEITGSHVVPETEEVFVQLLKRVKKRKKLLVSPPALKLAFFLALVKS